MFTGNGVEQKLIKTELKITYREWREMNKYIYIYTDI